LSGNFNNKRGENGISIRQSQSHRAVWKKCLHHVWREDYVWRSRHCASRPSPIVEMDLHVHKPSATSYVVTTNTLNSETPLLHGDHSPGKIKFEDIFVEFPRLSWVFFPMLLLGSAKFCDLGWTEFSTELAHSRIILLAMQSRQQWPN